VCIGRHPWMASVASLLVVGDDQDEPGQF